MIIEIDQLVNQITSLQKKSAENDLKVFKEFFDASLWRLEELKKERAIFNGKKKDLIDFLAVKIRSIKHPNKISTFESVSFFLEPKEPSFCNLRDLFEHLATFSCQVDRAFDEYQRIMRFHTSDFSGRFCQKFMISSKLKEFGKKIKSFFI